mgnify:CR=1 FL=1
MFIDRDDNNSIVGLYVAAQREGQEELADDSPEIAAFREFFNNPVPGEVSSGQLIVALAELDWLDAVDAAVAQADALSQRLWARASRFPRNDPMVVAIGTTIGKSSEQLDTLFRFAATK